MTNLTATTFNGNQAKVRFNWDTTGTYVFARILLRVDSPGSSWQTAGGFGVYYPQLFVNKFGLTPGQSYRAQGRTFCDSNITAYRSPTWTSPPVFWTHKKFFLELCMIGLVLNQTYLQKAEDNKPQNHQLFAMKNLENLLLTKF
jgi:hypothetical protein